MLWYSCLVCCPRIFSPLEIFGKWSGILCLRTNMGFSLISPCWFYLYSLDYPHSCHWLLVICLDFYLQASIFTGLSSVSLGLTPQDMMIHLLFSCSTNSSVTFIVLGNWKGKGLFFIIVIIINIISVLHRCASIRAIETNSISDFRKLVAYWVLFSLISLFDHAFAKLLEW